MDLLVHQSDSSSEDEDSIASEKDPKRAKREESKCWTTNDRHEARHLLQERLRHFNEKMELQPSPRLIEISSMKKGQWIEAIKTKVHNVASCSDSAASLRIQNINRTTTPTTFKHWEFGLEGRGKEVYSDEEAVAPGVTN